MNNYQIAKLTSYKLIVKEAEFHLEVIAMIPKYAKAIVRLKAICNEIDSVNIQQSKVIKGVTTDKNLKMDDLMDFLVDVSGALHSYAIDNNNQILAAKVNYKESSVSKMSQPNLVAAAGIVLEEASKIAPEVLLEEGITVAEMTQFAFLFTQFNEVSSDPRSAIINRSSYTQQLADLFSEAADIKKNTLDRLASQFQRKAPEYYQIYKAASLVIFKRSPKTPPVADAAV